MDPQKISDRHPVLEFVALKKPRSRSLIACIARNIVICGRVRWRKPSVDVLFYLGPWAEDSVYTTEALQRGDHIHFTVSTTHFTSTTLRLTPTASRFNSTTSRLNSSISFDIWCMTVLVLSAPI